MGSDQSFRPDHIASQYRLFISFRCCLDRMQSCTSSTNLTICPIFDTYCTIGTNVTNQREVCLGVLVAWFPSSNRQPFLTNDNEGVGYQTSVLGVYTVLGETTRNPTNTMAKPLDSKMQLQLYRGVRVVL